MAKRAPLGLVGRTITEARPMTPKEGAAEGWLLRPDDRPTVLVLDDGTRLYAAQDAEGNGPGVFFGVNGDGSSFLLR
jgi:hypothetical protein